MATDFFGLSLEDVDADTIDKLVIRPLDDAMRTMHAFTCPNHGVEVNENGSFNLLADEVRSIVFVVNHWYELLSDLLPEDKPAPLRDILDDMLPYANGNQDYEISVRDALLLYPGINALDTIVTLRYVGGALLYVLDAESEDDV